MDQHSSTDTSAIMRGNFDEICQQVRQALQPVAVHAVWLYGAEARLYWMTSSILHDDVAARTALRAFASPRPPAVFVLPVPREAGLHQAGPCSFVAFRVADAKDRLVGVVMVIVPVASTPPAVTAPLKKVLAAFAAIGAPAQPEPAPPPPAAPPGPAAPPPPRAAQPTPGAGVAPRPQHPLLRAELKVYVQRLVPLEKQTRPKRYEILCEFTEPVAPELEADVGSLLDRRVFGDLLRWLQRHPRVSSDRQIALSFKLSKAALYDPTFVPFVQRCLARSGLPRGMIGMEIPAATPRKHVRAVTDFAVSLQHSGCFLVLDNFTLRTECFDALLLPGLRVIKLAHELTARMYTDKIMRAAIPAITQMAKVLDVQTVVKRTRMAADLVRLSAYGLDYVQSAAIAPAMPIAALAATRARDADGARPKPARPARRPMRAPSAVG